MNEKFKSWLADETIFYALLLVLVGICSFGLGRLSVTEQDSQVLGQTAAGVFLTEQPLSSQKTENAESDVVVVASKSGSKYHLPDCPGASQIKPANIVNFTSIETAEAAGYTPAANCDFE